MNGLPTRRAHELTLRTPQQRWLIEPLWAERAVGIIGGEPKCCKSLLALELAVAVASGRACLRRFSVARSGTVLLYAAEDSLALVRERLEGIAATAGAELVELPIQVITAERIRLDSAHDRERLSATVAAHRPVLLILDPFIRLHAIDENASAEVAPLLAYLRSLERRYQVAVAVVHHARKAAGRMRSGQALRGSSEFHGWGDSNLYLRRTPGAAGSPAATEWPGADRLVLEAEHRAAASPAPMTLRLRTECDRPALELVDEPAHHRGPTDGRLGDKSARQRVEQALANLDQPVTLRRLRELCRIRTETLSETLTSMIETGHIVHTDRGYRLTHP